LVSETLTFLGWDIGGVYVKAVRIDWQTGKLIDTRTAIQPLEMWHECSNLSAILRDVGVGLGLDGVQAMAVTMTAELSDAFRSKREGVLFILDAVGAAFPGIPVYLLNIDGDIVKQNESLNPLDYAATNWLASAQYLATRHSDFILMDVGSTTTDIIPVRKGCVVSRGRTDIERLASGELVYTGLLRSNPDTVTSQVPIQGQMCRVAAEFFSNMGDVYLILGHVAQAEYSCPTPDGRAKTAAAAAERLARFVCADAETLDAEQIFKLARYLFEKQLEKMTEALLQVLSAQDDGYGLPVIAAGAGSFLAAEAGRRLGLSVIDLEKEYGKKSAAAFSSLAVGCLVAIRFTRAD